MGLVLLQIRITVQDRHQCRALPYVPLCAMKHSPLICAFVVVSASLALNVSAKVVQVMDRPFASTETLHKSAANAKPHVVQKRASGKVQVAYFSNWYILCCPESLHPGY